MKNVFAFIVTLAMILSVVPTFSYAADSSVIFSASFDEGIAAETGKIEQTGSGFEVRPGIHGNAAYIPAGAGNYLLLTDGEGNNNLLVGKTAVTITFFEKRDDGDGRWPLFAAPGSGAQVYNGENYFGLFDYDAFRVERYVNGRDKDTSSQVVGSVTSGWKHIAIVLTDEYTELFVNGASVGKKDSKSTIADLFATTSYVQLGRGNWNASGEDFSGYIDEFKIFDGALTDEEIAKEAIFDTPIEDVAAILSVPAETETDITLTTGYMGASIEWTSSDESVLTGEGKVTRYGEDKTVKLTAKITNDAGKTGTKDFNVTVKAIPLEDIEAAVKINDTDNILDSVTLAEKVGGVEIKWTSSNPEVVTDKAMENPDSKGYTIPAGYVTRTDKDEKVTVSYEYSYGGETKTGSYELTVKAAPAEEKKVAYLYAYFRGNVNGENERLSIHLATSEDGYNWTDLNGNFPVIESKMGTESLRDPYILRSRYGDKFYLVATDLNTQDGSNDWDKWSMRGSKYLMVWASEDLVNWGEQRMVKFADDNIGCAWAPESVYDVDTGEYLVYASGKDLNYYNETGVKVDTVFVSRTRDFYSFSEPEIFFIPTRDGNRVSAIDSNIIQADDGRYYHFYKKENSYIMMMASDHAAGPYEEVAGFETIGGEGPASYKVNGTNQYALCVDDYSKYVPYLTDDIASGKFTKSTTEVTMPTGSKHGGMIPISQKEYDALLEAYGPEEVDADGAGPAFTADFEDEAATEGLLKGGAAIAEDEETGSKVLKLDGVKDNASYFQFPEKLFDRQDTFTLLMDVKSAMTGNFFTFALGQGDGSDHYMYFRARQNELCLAETVYGYQHERKALTGADGINGQWARIALVVKPGYLAVYKDGKLVTENADARVGDAGALQGGQFTTSHLGVDGLVAYLGKSLFAADNYVNGSYDNIALYHRALSPAEIAVDYDSDVSVEDMLKADIDGVNVPAEAKEDITLPTEGAMGSKITWTSSDPAITAEGKVTRPALSEEDKKVTLTAEFTLAGQSQTKTYEVTVKAGGPLWHSAAGGSWIKHDFTPVDGKTVTLSFELTPKELTDATVAFGPSALTPNAWGSYNVCVRTTKDGTIQANNGDGSFSGDVPYEAGKTYDFVIYVNPQNKTYTVYVCDIDSDEDFVLVAEDRPFRDKMEGALSWIRVMGGDGVAADTFTVDNFRAVGLTATPSLRIFDGEETASFGIAYDVQMDAMDDAVAGVDFYVGAALADSDGNYTDVSSDEFFASAQPVEGAVLDGDGKCRVTIKDISNKNSARSYVLVTVLNLYNGDEMILGTDATLYGVLAESIMNAAGTKIPEARLKAANEIISFVAQNSTENSGDRFPDLLDDKAVLYDGNGDLREKAAGLGISDSVALQSAAPLSLEAVDMELAATDVTEAASGDITVQADLVPEL